MTRRKMPNLAASVRDRLQQVARSADRPFQEVLQYYAMERFLYRLSVSPHADRFVLKGALMLTVWGTASTRPTRDIDLLGYLPNQVETLVQVVRDICNQEVPPDGLEFHALGVTARIIKEDADYEGVRVTFQAKLQNARIPMQIDIGFGDTVHPIPLFTSYPVILDLPPPRLRAYPRETTKVAHDIGVSAMYFAVRRLRPEDHQLWVDEERLAPFRRRQKLPDAVLAHDPVAPLLVLEFGGKYSKERLRAFHEDCEERGLPYEIW